MTETLTESFCERCGTRYEFKAPTRLNPLRKTKGFIGGLKNWVTSQDDMSDAMRDAMRMEEEALASAQLEAFHESFNFCIDCRQYTCVNCWNDDAGRCRSCAPIPGTDDLAERLAASMAGDGTRAVAEPVPAEAEAQPDLGPEAWPTSDLPMEPVVGHHPDVAWPDADKVATAPEPAAEPIFDGQPMVEPEPVVAEAEIEPEPAPLAAELVPEPEPVVAEIEPEPEPVVAEIEPEPVVAEIEPEPERVLAEVEAEPVVAEAPEEARPPLRVLAWEPDGAYELLDEAEPEQEPVVAEIEPEPEPMAAELEPVPVVAEAELEPETAAATPEALPEDEPLVAADVEPEPEFEPVAAAADADPMTAPEPEPVAAEAEEEEEEEAAEPVAAQEPEPEPAPERPRIAPISETILRFPRQDTPARAEPERQVAADESPEVAARRAQLDLLGLGDVGEGSAEPDRPAVLPYRSRGAAPRAGDIGARAGGGFWEASAREVAGAAGTMGVQNCGQCGLSLSANARFCRRCGTRQARSA